MSLAPFGLDDSKGDAWSDGEAKQKGYQRKVVSEPTDSILHALRNHVQRIAYDVKKHKDNAHKCKFAYDARPDFLRHAFRHLIPT